MTTSHASTPGRVRSGPGGPFDPRTWRSPLRGPWLTSVLALVLLVGLPVLLVLAVQSRILGRGEESSPGDAGEKGMVYPLARWKAPVFGLLLGLIVFSVGGPLFSVAMTGLIKAYGLPLAWENLTLDHFRFVLFELDRTRVAARSPAGWPRRPRPSRPRSAAAPTAAP